MGPAPSRCDDDYRTSQSIQSTSSVATTEPVLIEWKNGGTDVYVTGTFNGWRSKVPMKEYENGVWRVKIYAPPGRVEYKFIVDGFWKYSPDQPKLQDQLGNTNNYINVIPSSVKENENDNINTYSSASPNLEMLDNIKPSVLPIGLDNSPLNTPMHIKRDLQDTLLLSIPDHTIIGHLFINNLGASNIKSYSISTRHDTKYVTTLMYFPKDNSNDNEYVIEEEDEEEEKDNGEITIQKKKQDSDEYMTQQEIDLIKRYDNIVVQLKMGK